MEWSVAVFAARESAEVLDEAVQAIEQARGGERTIDVLVNGNLSLAQEVAHRTASRSGRQRSASRTRVWFLPVADKATAWNAYLHEIWRPGTLAHFVDGYAVVEAASFEILTAALEQAPSALAATGVPSVGRSAHAVRRSILSSGGMHGNLHSLTPAAMAGLRARQFRLPSFIYRTDALIGAVLCFNLDPGSHFWDPTRIVVCPEATWHHRPLRWWHPSDLKSQAFRRIRQAQGRLENGACKHLLADRRTPIGALPADVLALLDTWMVARPDEVARTMLRDPLTHVALHRLRRGLPSRMVATSAHFQRIDPLRCP